MTKFIVNGDDFGYSRGVNYGIIDAHTQGILTSATLMTNMPGADHAYELAAAHPTLGVGIHLNLTLGKPILPIHRTIVNENGTFHPRSYYESSCDDVDTEEIYAEWKAQVEHATKRGLEPTHLDSHHHIHSYPQITEVFVALAKDLNLPTRTLGSGEKQVEADLTGEVTCPDHFEENLHVLRQPPEKLRAAFQHADTVEIMTHPAYLDKLLMDQSSLLYPRLEDLDVLLDQEVRQNIKKSGISLVNYRVLKS